jgi:hypothetical protein
MILSISVEGTTIVERLLSIGLHVVFSNSDTILAKQSSAKILVDARASLRGFLPLGDNVFRATAGDRGNCVQTSRWHFIKQLLGVLEARFCVSGRIVDVISLESPAKDKT